MVVLAKDIRAVDGWYFVSVALPKQGAADLDLYVDVPCRTIKEVMSLVEWAAAILVGPVDRLVDRKVS